MSGYVRHMTTHIKVLAVWIRTVGVAGALSLAAGCGNGAGQAEEVAPELDPVLTAAQDIVDVDQTPAKRQSIGNCWIYATTSWAESLSLTATGAPENFSETYWTYWHWFDQIVTRRPASLTTGGGFSTMTRLISTYGVVSEGHFIPNEDTAEMSMRQKSALASMNQALASGALANPAARANRVLVRQELDRAFALAPETVAELDRVFGADVSRSFASRTAPDSETLRDASTVRVSYLQADGSTKNGDLRSALRDWTESYYPRNTTSRRAFQQRFQRALHSRLPVLLTWFVDFNALDNSTGSFAGPPTSPGNQGYHMTVAEDYAVRDVPGFGTLPAGVLETRPEALAAALDPSASLMFIRTKNSWGGLRPDRKFVEGFPGYHDLHFAYLNGPVKECAQTNGATDTSNCPSDLTPFVSVIMPRGF
jgi:hypothetical protein